MKFPVLFVLFSAMVWQARAASVYTFSDAPIATDSQLSLGFVFTANSAITISSLGYFDAGQDGFATAHTVGIFDASGNLLASTTLASGASGRLDGSFRFQTIAPLLLAAGETYTLAATTGGANDPWAYGDAGDTLKDFTVDPRISIAQDAARYLYQSDDVLRDPTEHYRYTLYAGPSFEIGVAPVPEPAASLLLATGLGAALIGFRFRSRI